MAWLHALGKLLAQLHAGMGRVQLCAPAAPLRTCTQPSMHRAVQAHPIRADLRHRQPRNGAQPCALEACCAVLCPPQNRDGALMLDLKLSLECMGGYCFESNCLLAEALVGLGFEVYCVAGRNLIESLHCKSELQVRLCRASHGEFACMLIQWTRLRKELWTCSLAE